MSEPSIFTRIINGEIPAYKIYEDDRVIAFLTIQPFSTGHTLVVPKKQIDQIWDLDSDDYDYLWRTTKKIAQHLTNIMKADRIGVVVKGFDVPHAHIHLVPIPQGVIVNLDPYTEPSMAKNDELAAMAKRLKM